MFLKFTCFLIPCDDIFNFKVLLTYNGLEFDENAKREILESLVRKNLLQDEEGEDDDWEPPNDDVMNWKSPVSLATLFPFYSFAISCHINQFLFNSLA